MRRSVFRVKRPITAVLVAIAISTAALALNAQPAGALTYGNLGPNDMTGNVRAGNPLFGCASVTVYMGGIRITAPPDYGNTRVFVVMYVYRWNGTGWSYLNQVTPVEGGQLLYPGKSFVTPSGSGPYTEGSTANESSPNGYAYYTYVQVKFRYNNSSTFYATLNLLPNQTGDYRASRTGQVSVNGGLYTYCVH